MKRVFLGGIDKEATEKQLRERFEKFGSIEKVSIHTKNLVGFAYLSMDISDEQYKKMVSVYHGTKWKSNTIRIQEAKPIYTIKLEQERAMQRGKESLPKKKKIKNTDNRFVDIPFQDRKGWVLFDGVYYPAFKTRLPPKNREKVINPAKMKNRLRFRLQDLDVPVQDLYFPFEETDTSQSFRKYCGIFTDEEELLAKQANIELRQLRQAQIITQEASKLSKNEYNRQIEENRLLNEEMEITDSIIKKITPIASSTRASNETDVGVVTFDDELVPESNIDLDGLYDSD